MEYMSEGVVLATIARDYAYRTDQYHSHPWYEVYFLNRGSREFAYSGQMITLQEGEAFLARPGILHYAWGEIPHEKYGLEFSEKYISRYLTPVVREEFLHIFEYNHIVLNEEEQREYRRVFKETLGNFEKEKRDESLGFTGVLLLLGILKKAAKHQAAVQAGIRTEHRELPEGIQTVLSYIRGHFTAIHSLEEIAEACYINKYYLSRGFRKYMGMTVMEYMNMLRLEQACELLVKTELGIGEIAEACGYMNKSHFSTLFKRNMGASPTAFKAARHDYRHTTAESYQKK